MADPYDGLDEQFMARLRALVDASGGGIQVKGGTYGFRPLADQQRLWDQAVAKYGSEAAARKWVAVPGKSNHGKGVAYDLTFTNDEARRWAHANAARFGLYFPMDHEPWHIEAMDTAVDFDEEAYTTPPIGQPPAGDPHDPAFQFARMIAALDREVRGIESPFAALAQAPTVDLGEGAMQADPAQTRAPVEDFGFAEEPARMAEQIDEVVDDGRS